MSKYNKDETFYIRDLVAQILEEVEEAKNEEDFSDLEVGKILAYYSVLLSIKEDYGSDIDDLSEIGLNIDLEKTLLDWNK